MDPHPELDFSIMSREPLRDAFALPEDMAVANEGGRPICRKRDTCRGRTCRGPGKPQDDRIAVLVKLRSHHDG